MIVIVKELWITNSGNLIQVFQEVEEASRKLTLFLKEATPAL